MSGQDLPCGLSRFFQNVEKRANALGLEDEPASVSVGFNTVVQALLRQDLLERQRVPEPLGDVDQDWLFAFEKVRFPLHRGNSVPCPSSHCGSSRRLTCFIASI